MSDVLIEESTLQNIASAIRNKNGLATTYKVSEMANAINAFPSGGSGSGFTADMIAMPSGITGDINGSATKIASYAFNYCTKLENVTFSFCTSIGSDAFAHCQSLQTASFPVCTTITNRAFYSCYLLVSLYLTSVSAVPTLGDYAFTSTPIGGYSTMARRYGSVYVPSSLYNSFLTAVKWSNISARIVSV